MVHIRGFDLSKHFKNSEKKLNCNLNDLEKINLDNFFEFENCILIKSINDLNLNDNDDNNLVEIFDELFTPQNKENQLENNIGDIERAIDAVTKANFITKTDFLTSNITNLLNLINCRNNIILVGAPFCGKSYLINLLVDCLE